MSFLVFTKNLPVSDTICVMLADDGAFYLDQKPDIPLVFIEGFKISLLLGDYNVRSVKNPQELLSAFSKHRAGKVSAVG